MLSNISTLTGFDRGMRIFFCGTPNFLQTMQKLNLYYPNLTFGGFISISEDHQSGGTVDNYAIYTVAQYLNIKRVNDAIIVGSYGDEFSRRFAEWSKHHNVNAFCWSEWTSFRKLYDRYILELGYGDDDDAHMALYEEFRRQYAASNRSTVVSPDPDQYGPILDDHDALDALVRDGQASPAVYQPSPHWQRYQTMILSFIKNAGLARCRSDRNSPLAFCGGSDFLEPMLPDEDAKIYDFTNFVGKRSLHAKSLEECSMSLAGYPGHSFSVGANNYSWQFLRYYLRYAFAARHFDFSKSKLILELAPGFGRQIEILKKLHPQNAFLLFDTAPEIYAAERYLSAVFPGDVRTYRQTRESIAYGPNRAKFEPGKIYCYGAWDFEHFFDIKVDLFWTSGSLQYLNSATLRHYLNLVSRITDQIYMYGKCAGQANHEMITLMDIMDLLPDFEAIDSEPGLIPSAAWIYDFTDTFCRRRS